MTTRRASVILLVAAVAYTVASWTDSSITFVVVDSIGVAAVAFAWAGARRHRAGGGRGPWVLIASGLTLWLVGDVIWDLYDLTVAGIPAASPADVAYLAAYPLIAAGLVGMIRLRAPGRWGAGLMDAVGVAMASGLAAWVFLVPVAESPSYVDEMLAVAYPLGDVMLLAALSWLLLAPGIRGVPSALILGGLVFNLALDVVVLVDAITQREVLHGWFDNAYPLTYLLIALAANHARSTELTLPDPSPTDRLQPARVVFLGIALFSGPTIAAFSASARSGHRLLVLMTTVAIGLIVLTRFVTALREVEQSRHAISVIAGTDVLTGLDNRRRFLESGERSIERLRTSGSEVGVLMIDVDHFKQINDTYGHAAGDAVLVELSRRCLTVVRPFDLVGRLGGDEFAVLLPSCGPDDAVAVARRLADSVADTPFRIAAGERTVGVTLSIGVASGRFESMERALADADHALYEAKRRGRDRWWIDDDGRAADQSSTRPKISTAITSSTIDSVVSRTR